LDEVPRDINKNRIIDYMLFMTGAQGETFYADVKKLPASHQFTISNNILNISKYFTFDPEYELGIKSDGEYAEAFNEIMTNVVREQSRSAYPIGTTLSGGLDSSSVSVLARNICQQTRGESIHTFSAIFPDLPIEQFEKSDERKYMDAVINQADGIIPHFVNASKHSPYDGIDATMERYDGIVTPPNRYIEAAIYRTAQQQGVRVILEGHDGDTTISYGLDRLRDLGRSGDIFTLVSEYRLLQYRYESKFSIKKLLVDYVIKPRLSPRTLKFIQNIRGNAQHRPLVFSMLHPDIKNQIDYDHLRHQMLGYDPLEYSNARTEHARSMSWSAWEMAQEFKDIDAATYSVEARYPFWDRRLMKFCLALPVDQKLNKGWTRSILRRGMRDILPDVICNRVKKSTLAPNVLKKISELNQKDVDYWLLDEQGPLSELIDIKIVSDAWRSISKDPYNNKHLGMPIHMLLVLSMWLDQQK
jgi:asparagine synthase (glutamine-hydrolysing)